MNEVEQEEMCRAIYGVQEQDEKKAGQLVLFENFMPLSFDKDLSDYRTKCQPFVGVHPFAPAKSTNVTDLQNALKTRTLIFDREEKEAGALSGQKGPMSNFRILVKICRMLLLRQKIEVSIKIVELTMDAFSGNPNSRSLGWWSPTITQQLAKNAHLSQDQTVQS